MEKEYTEYLDNIINNKSEILEDEIKHAVKVLMDIYVEKRFITYLRLMKEEITETEEEVNQE